MDKLTLFFAFALLASASSFLIKVPTRTTPTKERTSSTGWIHLQKLILPLFENICEESSNPTIVRLSQEFDAGASSGWFLRPEALSDFNNWKSSKGFLPKGETFIVFKPEHVNELKVIYGIFYFAKDFDTFYKTAAWARQNVNCGLFMHALYLAMLNRRDTEHLSVPAPYELLPNYFIRKDFIIKASSLLSGEEFASEDNIRVEGNSYIVDTNYTSDFYNNDLETKLAYFQEDIGLNSYYFLQRLKFIPWFKNDVDNKEGYGEYLYHVMKQLSIRYDLERYSNGLEEVEIIDWSNFAVTYYDPMLIYSNGNEFGYRYSKKLLENDVDLGQIKTIEINIHTEVTRMIKEGSTKSAILDYLMDVLVRKDLSYDVLAHRIMGKISDNNELTALAHYLTSLRDPVFWRINKKIVDIVDDALKNFQEYTRNELIFPGVEVKNVEIKKMATSIDKFVFDVTDALKPEDQGTNFQVKISQPRLNRKAFSLKLNISSVMSQKGLVKIYVGPKVAPGTHASNKNMFMLLDSFEWNMKAGSNAISRSSEEMNNFSEDFTTLQTLHKVIEDAEFGIYSSPLKPFESSTGFPSRLMIPKGTTEGLPLQIFVFVAPFSKTTDSSFSIPSTEFNSAVLSPGYPLDLDIKNSMLFRLPNTIIKDFTVTHKGDGKVSEYGRPSNTKPVWKEEDKNFDYSARQNEQFNYSMKQGQYENKVNVPRQDIVDDSFKPEIKEKLDNTLTEKVKIDETIVTKKSIQPMQTEVDDFDEKAIKKVPLLKASYGQNGYSKNDYSYKRKERFDYKTKKDQYKNKVDYSKRRDGYNKISDIKDTSDQVNVDKKENVFEVSTQNYQTSIPPLEVLEVKPVSTGSMMAGDLYDVVRYRPLQKLSSLRAPTVYDYLFPNRLDEDTEDENLRVYE